MSPHVASSCALFREKLPLQARREQAEAIRRDAPRYVPFICEPHPLAGLLPPLATNKYRVEPDAKLRRLREAIRSDAGLQPSDSLFLYAEATSALLDDETTVAEVDAQNVGEDGFVYVHVSALPPEQIASEESGSGCFSRLLQLAQVSPDRCLPPRESGREEQLYMAKSGERRDSAPPEAENKLKLEELPSSRVEVETIHASPTHEKLSLVSPHGDRFGQEASIASCTFLNPRARENPALELQPSRGGRIPAALMFASLLDVTAVGLVVPMLSSYSRQLNGSPRFTGLLQATYGLTQLMGANMLGGLSDSLGRRRMLQLSALGGMCGYACLVFAVGEGGSLALLLASRVPIGLLKQSLTVSRAAVVDCTLPSTRIRPMARLGATVGAGFVIGPVRLIARFAIDSDT
ncbi:MAG: hypothetical protein SGPRY_008640 [Prymnesium sp.]